MSHAENKARDKRQDHLLVRTLVFMVLLSMVLMAVPQSAASQEQTTTYRAVKLVSNVPGQADNIDFLLMDPWGLESDTGTGLWWVADEGSGRVTYYDGSGLSVPVLAPMMMIVPLSPGSASDYAMPVAIVRNDTDGFELVSGIPAKLLVVTRGGTIAGWNGNANKYEAVLVKNNSPEAGYTGAATALTGETLLYAANFRQGRIETYDTNFSFVVPAGNAFNDPLIPDGYAPFNIRNIHGLLYVTYAEPQGNGSAIAGEGAGYVDAFSPEGRLFLRFGRGPWMNAPWGVALAPSGFGDFSGRLLVANTGSGRIASFDPVTGVFLGYLPGEDGSPLVIPGLHGIAFGSSGNPLAGAELFFTAGAEGGRNSSMGSISVSSGPGT